MLTSNSYKSKQFWWLVFKLIILIFLSVFIYNSLMHQEELSLETFSKVLTESSVLSFTSILILIAFTSSNWMLEITKWKVLSNQIESVSWKKATCLPARSWIDWCTPPVQPAAFVFFSRPPQTGAHPAQTSHPAHFNAQ